ncbi:MAG: hypothetical protein PVH73_01035 [Candidatus Bathyarchaeota archaeon]|jgi:hypothetical protein
MPKRRESTLKSQFQARRTRLLYYIYKSRKRQIKNDLGIKSRLKRAFKYKSDSHLYHDFNYLIDHGLLEEKNGFYKVTKAGREEFKLLSTIHLAIVVSLFLGIYIIIMGTIEIVFSMVLFGADFFLILGAIMLAYSTIYWYSLKTFSPRPPDERDELVN